MSTYKVYQSELDLWAGDEYGSLNAVNDFLRTLGVEWYMPGEFGEVCPQRASIPLPDVDRTVRPEFGGRNMSFYLNAPFLASADEFLWQLRLSLYPQGAIGGHPHGGCPLAMDRPSNANTQGGRRYYRPSVPSFPPHELARVQTGRIRAGPSHSLRWGRFGASPL